MPHIHDKIDFTVAAFIVHQQKVLLVDHKQLKKWLPVGGHIELDEDPQQALFREIKEESGLTKNQLTPLTHKGQDFGANRKSLLTPNFLDIHPISKTHRHIGMVYFFKSTTNQITLADQEHHHIKWFSKKDLNDPKYQIGNDIKFYARQALKKASQKN